MLGNEHGQPPCVPESHLGEQAAVGQWRRAFGVIVISQPGALPGQLQDYQDVIVAGREQARRKVSPAVANPVTARPLGSNCSALSKRKFRMPALL
jgi:hypothetical protein